MSKEIWKAGNMIYPIPAVMVSCSDSNGKTNIITISWTGTVNTNPAMCYISVRPSRYSQNMIKESGEFVINLTNKKLTKAADWCGVRSGKDYDKFKTMKLTPLKGKFVNAPLIKEAPVNIECRVQKIIPLGSHDMFLAEILAVHADKKLIDPKSNAFLLNESNLVSYIHGAYYESGDKIGKFGFSVEKKKKK